MIVALAFRLDEDVTPDLFARRVAQACAKNYALRPGEAVILSDGRELIVSDTPVDVKELFPERTTE